MVCGVCMISLEKSYVSSLRQELDGLGSRKKWSTLRSWLTIQWEVKTIIRLIYLAIHNLSEVLM
jgi:hypothetical protein